MNIVITGATSMIGIATICELIKSDNLIYAVIRNNSTNINRLPQSTKIKTIICNIDDYQSLPPLIGEKCDVFYHFAWAATGVNRNKNSYSQIDNIKYTIDAISAANQLGCKKFIGAGSQAEYGPINLQKWSPYSPTNPIQAYGIAKLAAYQFAVQECKRNGMILYWVRIFSVYGYLDKSSTLVSKLINSMKQNEDMPLSPCTQIWDYLYSSDAGTAFSLMASNGPNSSRIYCLGSGTGKVLSSYVEIIKQEFNENYKLQYGAINFNENSILCLCADISDLIRDFGWIPKVSFENGIQEIRKLIMEDSQNHLENK